MKVYSWKTLLATIIVGGGVTAYSVYGLIQGDVIKIAWILLGIYYITEGLKISFTEDAYKKDQENARKAKQIYGKYFGKFAPFAPYGALILFIIAYVLIKLFSDHLWIGMIFLLLAPVYQWAIYSMMKEERKSKE